MIFPWLLTSYAGWFLFKRYQCLCTWHLIDIITIVTETNLANWCVKKTIHIIYSRQIANTPLLSWIWIVHIIAARSIQSDWCNWTLNRFKRMICIKCRIIAMFNIKFDMVAIVCIVTLSTLAGIPQTIIFPSAWPFDMIFINNFYVTIIISLFTSHLSNRILSTRNAISFCWTRQAFAILSWKEIKIETLLLIEFNEKKKRVLLKALWLLNRTIITNKLSFCHFNSIFCVSRSWCVNVTGVFLSKTFDLNETDFYGKYYQGPDKLWAIGFADWF